MADQTTTPAASPCGAPSGRSGGAAQGTASPGTEASGAGAAGGAQQGWMGSMSMLAIFILIFYFFIMRPQRKKQKQHEALIGGIGRGDQIITIGGFFGTVREVRDDTFLIEVADGVKVRILKSAIQTKHVTQPAPAEKG